MNNTQNSIVYAVNSDLDDEILYAEFETKDAAIAYAKRNLDKLPFVDELHVSRDANGEIDDVFEYKTIWDHTMADETKEETEDDYWDDLETMYDAEEDGKHVIGDTTWFESMNNLVETLEENEDMVECKECFELFPKAECIKLAVGYVCPTCAECGTVSEEDIFKMDFPECEKMSVGNDMIPGESDKEILSAEAEDEIDSISTPEEVVPFLVKDEEEAIAGYEQAEEVIEASDVENKEEILKVLDHIKREEEEHIEELTELTVIDDSEKSKDETDPISKDEVEEIEDPEATEDSTLAEHVNEEHPAVESTQELEGTDNAVVDCKVAKVVTHSEDEKPVDCEGKREPLNKALTEALTHDELSEIFRLCKEIGIVTGEDLNRFIREVPEGENLLDKLRAYRAELGDDFKIEEKLTEAKSDFFRDVIFEAIDYLTEFSDIFPVPENIGAANWEELKDDINYGLSSDFEIAEIIMEYLQKDLAISEKHPEIFEDDPQSELTLETYNRLKRAYDKAVADYEAKYSEDFKEQKYLDESAVLAGVATGVIVDVVKRIMDKFGDRKKKSKWIDFRKYIIEKTPEGQINIWNLDGEQVESDLKTVKAAKEKIKLLPKPKKVKSTKIETDLEDEDENKSVEKSEELTKAKITMSKAEMEKLDKEVEEATKEVAKYNIPMRSQKNSAGETEGVPDFEAVPEVQREAAKKAYDRYTKALAARPDRAKYEIEYLDEDVDEDTYEPVSNDPAEKPSKDVKMANTASLSGMDFEAACQKFGVNLEN